MTINKHPFPSNTIEVSSKDTSRVKLLTSDSAQNKGAVDPKVQATTTDVKGKGLLFEEVDLKPRQPVMSQMLINKFQRRQEKVKGRKEWARCNEGHWRCLFFKYYWKEGIKLPIAENCPKCNGAYNNNISSKRFCFNDRRPVAGGHCEFSNQRISDHDQLGQGQSPRSAGGKASVHDRLGGRVNERSNDRWRWPILWSLVKISCVELLNVDALCN
jgi:hypothetical protein